MVNNKILLLKNILLGSESEFSKLKEFSELRKEKYISNQS